MSGHARSSRGLFAAAVALSLLVLAVRVEWYHRVGLMPDLVLDDAYISFRYARNLVEGEGLVFNPGERVEGYTNFLWTVLIAGALAAGADPEPAAEVLAFLAAAGTVLLLALLARRLLRGPLAVPAAFLPPLLFAALGSQARHVVSGMETLLFVLLVFAGFACLLWNRGRSENDPPPVGQGPPYDSRQPGAVGLRAAASAGVVLALAAMTRPEGILYAAIAGLLVVVEARPAVGRPRAAISRARLKVAALFSAGFALLYLPYTAWRLAYYGSLLPNTYYAKVAGPRPEVIARGWEYLGKVPDYWPVVPILGVAALALPSVRKDRVWAWPLLVVLACSASFVYLGGDFLAFFGPRMLMPGLPFLLLLAAEGLCAVGAALPWRLAGRGIVVLGVLGLAAYALAEPWPKRGGKLGGIASLHEGFRASGGWLARHGSNDSLIATPAAGIMPWVTGWRTVDMYGLTDRHIAREAAMDPRMPAAHAKSDPVYVLERRPDYLISDLAEDGRPRTARLGWVADRVAREYELVAQVKIRRGRLVEGRRVIETDRFRPDLYHKLYEWGIFRRRAELEE